MRKFVSLLLLFTAVVILGVTTGQVVASKGGVVAAANPYAAAIGAEILERGGNAVDAAVAVGFALSVVEPYASGLGGEGVMVIRTSDGQSVVIDYKSTAPMDLSVYTESPSKYRYGPLAPCVPGVVDGLVTALEEWGTMKLSEVLEPVIELARNGFVINDTFAGVLSDNYERLLEDPGEAAAVYLKDGLLYESGDIFKNPALADTLELIAKEGRDAFYRGEIADKIDAFMRENGGAITKKDLENYHALVKEPLVGTYRGYNIITAPPPVGGMVLIEILNILERFNISDLDWYDPLYIHLMADSIYLAALDKRAYMGDNPEVPVAGLISKEYAKERFQMIDLDKAFPRPKSFSERLSYAGDPFKYDEGKSFIESIFESLPATVTEESPSTTHVSVVDRFGNAVAFTQTLSSFFGSGNVIPGTGIILNNEFHNFSSSGPNAVAPGKRPVTTIVPTIVTKPDGEIMMVIGTPGAARILSTVAQIIVNVIDFGYSLPEAIKLPKFCSYDSYTNLRLEGGFPPETVKILEDYFGYDVAEYGPLDLYFGGPNAVYRNEDGVLVGVGSFRRQGGASGVDW